jgi:recombination protein RecA
MRLSELKKTLGEGSLVTPEKVSSFPGCTTGFTSLDQFLLWKGFPKGALSLLTGEVGLGATRLWTQAAAQLTAEKRWAAWINGAESELNAAALKKMKFDRLFWISAPVDLNQKLWALQEVCSLSLFDLIGCDLEGHTLRSGQILKLKKIALRYQVALVLFSRVQRSHPFFSLVMEFRKNNIAVVRALHRPTPHLIERRELYADTLPQLAAGRKALCGGKFLDLQPTGSLPGTGVRLCRY